MSLFSPPSSAKDSKNILYTEPEGDGSFFTNPDKTGRRLKPLVLQIPPLATPVAPNEPHSPAWGDTECFTQPHLGALRQLPPASVLQGDSATEHVQQHVAQKWSEASRSRRSSHYERALKTAKWTAQPAEKGNGGLRNAVYAATQKGDLSHVTWVSN